MFLHSEAVLHSFSLQEVIYCIKMAGGERSLIKENRLFMSLERVFFSLGKNPKVKVRTDFCPASGGRSIIEINNRNRKQDFGVSCTFSAMQVSECVWTVNRRLISLKGPVRMLRLETLPISMCVNNNSHFFNSCNIVVIVCVATTDEVSLSNFMTLYVTDGPAWCSAKWPAGGSVYVYLMIQVFM